MSQFMRNVDSKRNLVYALEVKGKSALPIFTILFRLGQIYLPERRYCTLAYLKSLLSGEKSFFKNQEVRPVKVPRYKTLSIKHVLEYAMSRRQISKYLPDQDDKSEPQVDRDFVFTIVNTVDPNYFPSQLARIENER